MSSFHIFALETEGNMGDTSAERPRIEVACDASLDEGAIIRTTNGGISLLAGPTGYFLGLDRPEAEGVRQALVAFRNSDREEFDDNWGEMVLARVERLLGYINDPEEGESTSPSPWPTLDAIRAESQQIQQQSIQRAREQDEEGGDEPPFPAPLFPVGTRVRLTEDVERYPHFIAPKGATGTVTIAETDLFAVRLDDHLDGAETWDNEVHLYMQGEAGDADDPRGYLELLDGEVSDEQAAQEKSQMADGYRDFVNRSRLEQMSEAELRTLVAEGGPSALIDAAQAEIDRRGEQALDEFQAEQDRDFDAAEAEGKRTLTAVFDVTGLTDRQVENLAGAVEVQAETNKEEEPYYYPSVPVLKVEVDPPLPAADEPRTILVHLNIELPADAPATADDVAREIASVIEVGTDHTDGPSNTPALVIAKVEIPLAEEI